MSGILTIKGASSLWISFKDCPYQLHSSDFELLLMKVAMFLSPPIICVQTNIDVISLLDSL